MNVVDSSGWLEYFAGGANWTFFAPAIVETTTLIVPTICVYEVYRRLLTQRGESDALQAMGIMSLGVIADLTDRLAIYAAKLATELRLEMADSIILATARANEASLWTQDADLAGIAGVKYIPARK